MALFTPSRLLVQGTSFLLTPEPLLSAQRRRDAITHL